MSPSSRSILRLQMLPQLKPLLPQAMLPPALLQLKEEEVQLAESSESG